MLSDMLYGNKYKYILSRIDAASGYTVAGPLRTKQAKDMVDPGDLRRDSSDASS